MLAWIHAQCARGACADEGFAADIWAAHDAGEIGEDEAPILVRSLLTAGLDTTVNGFANAILAFAMNPEQWQRVRADRSLIKPAFDEVLRWESPVQTFFRTTTRAIEVGGNPSLGEPEGVAFPRGRQSRSQEVARPRKIRGDAKTTWPRWTWRGHSRLCRPACRPARSRGHVRGAGRSRCRLRAHGRTGA